MRLLTRARDARLRRAARSLRVSFRTRFALGTRPWQTTRVEPGGDFLSAVKRPRAAGTVPPAGGLIDVSAAGSGQYDARSTCAEAVVPAMTAAASRANATSIAFQRRVDVVWSLIESSDGRLYLSLPLVAARRGRQGGDWVRRRESAVADQTPLPFNVLSVLIFTGVGLFFCFKALIEGHSSPGDVAFVGGSLASGITAFGIQALFGTPGLEHDTDEVP